MRSRGNSNPAFRIAARTRSRLSRTAESGSPTVVNDGRPLVTSTSTETVATSTPCSAAERTFASMNPVCEGARSASMTQDRYSRYGARTGLSVSESLLEAQHGGPILLNAITPTPVLPRRLARCLDTARGARPQGERNSDHCHDGDPDSVWPFAIRPHWSTSVDSRHLCPGAESRDAAQNRCMRTPDDEVAPSRAMTSGARGGPRRKVMHGE